MSNNPTGPKDHYVPEFYLKRWARGGNLYSAKIISHTGELHWTSHAPKGTGYERGLYGEVEEKFFKPLDYDASKLLVSLHEYDCARNRKLEIGKNDHEIWARFLLAQIIRIPMYVHEVCKKCCDAGLDPDQAREQIPEIIGNERALKDIRSMEWVFAKVDTNLELITCDNPIIFKPRNLQSEDCVLIFPLGPKHFFLATHNQNIARLEKSPRKMVSYINQEIIKNANERIYARSKESISNDFVQKHWTRAT